MLEAKEAPMGIADIVILAAVAVAFVAVCVRIKRRGTCADCSEAGSCSGHCSPRRQRSCPACKGVDAVAHDLGKDVK